MHLKFGPAFSLANFFFLRRDSKKECFILLLCSFEKLNGLDHHEKLNSLICLCFGQVLLQHKEFRSSHKECSNGRVPRPSPRGRGALLWPLLTMTCLVQVFILSGIRLETVQVCTSAPWHYLCADFTLLDILMLHHTRGVRAGQDQHFFWLPPFYAMFVKPASSGHVQRNSS